MERVLKELDAVCESPDPDAVHDLRVAVRRCRSVAAVMEEVDPDAAWPDMRKLGKRLFRQLGELRDTQVLEDWAKKFGSRLRCRLRATALRLLHARKGIAGRGTEGRGEVRPESLEKAGTKITSANRLVPLDGLAAECLALERLEAAKELHVRALRAEKPEAWHELRIGVKRFRYTVESLLPTRYEDWGEQLKRIQDLLGEVHDLDVLAGKIEEIAGEITESRSAWTERIASQRHERIEVYRRLAIGEGSVWQQWRRGLPESPNAGGVAGAIACYREGPGREYSTHHPGVTTVDAPVRFLGQVTRRSKAAE